MLLQHSMQMVVVVVVNTDDVEAVVVVVGLVTSGVRVPEMTGCGLQCLACHRFSEKKPIIRLLLLWLGTMLIKLSCTVVLLFNLLCLQSN